MCCSLIQPLKKKHNKSYVQLEIFTFLAGRRGRALILGEALILNFVFKRGALIEGERLFERARLFDQIRYIFSEKCVFCQF